MMESSEQQQNHPEKAKGKWYWLFRNIWNKVKKVVGSFVKTKPFWTVVLILVIIYLLITGRGTLQPAMLFARKFYLLLLVVMVFLGVYYQRLKGKDWKHKIFITLVFGAVMLLLYWIGPRAYKYISLYTHYRTIDKIEIPHLPITDHERIQPLNSIRTLINQEALSETEDATTPRFVRGQNGKYFFTSCKGPSAEYKVQQFSKNMYQVLEIPGDLPSPNFSGKFRTDVEFVTGELLLFSKNAHISARKRFGLFKYFNYEPSDIFFLRNDKGDWVQVVSLIRWKGFLFPRPVFGGVMIQNQKGEGNSFFERLFLGHGQYLSPEEIQKKGYLIGQNLLPERVARFTAECFRFRHGFFAPMPFYHEGDIRIPELPRDQSPMPFVLYADLKDPGKLYNYFGLEPYQEQKKGLSLSLYLPGDGESKVYFMDHDQGDQNYIGSSAIPAKIIESKKNYDWSENYPAESRPYVREIAGKRRFFWLSTIVTKAGKNDSEYIGGSVPEITLTDANYGTVIWIEQDSLMVPNYWERKLSNTLTPYWKKEN